MTIRVGVADDQALVRDGLRAQLGLVDDMDVGLGDVARRRVGGFSMGMRQRLAAFAARRSGWRS